MTRKLTEGYNGRMTSGLMASFIAEGQRIAAQLGEGVRYAGPQDIKGIPVYHTFNDDAGTGSAFAGRGLLDSKAALMVQRMNFKLPLPNFPDVTDPIGTVKRMREDIDRSMDELFGLK